MLLTNAYNSHARQVGPTLAYLGAGDDPQQQQAVLDQLHLSQSQAQPLISQGLHFMGASFGGVYLVSRVLVACCLTPASFLPRRKPARPVDPAVMMGA